MIEDKAKYYKVRCPNCGHFFKVRFLELKGSLKYSVFCPDCKMASTVEVSDIKTTQQVSAG